jgi:multidrug transporter EmrE-like cation transporter
MILLSGLCVVLGDIFGKIWSENLNKNFFLLSILFYGLSSVFYMPALLKEGLTITSVIWSLISILGFLIVGILIFHEKLTPVQIIAVVLGMISLVLFSFSE